MGKDTCLGHGIGSVSGIHHIVLVLKRGCAEKYVTIGSPKAIQSPGLQSLPITVVQILPPGPLSSSHWDVNQLTELLETARSARKALAPAHRCTDFFLQSLSLYDVNPILQPSFSTWKCHELGQMGRGHGNVSVSEVLEVLAVILKLSLL